MKKPSIQEIIDLLGLEPLGREGGMFRSTYRSPALMPDGSNAGSAIFFFLTANAYSHLHRLPTDELYHFYLGDPVELLELFPDGQAAAYTDGCKESLPVLSPQQSLADFFRNNFPRA